MRRFAERDERIPPGTYELPASVVNKHGRVRLVRVGPDFDGVMLREAPPLSTLRTAATNETAAWLDAKYEEYRQRLLVNESRLRPPPMHSRYILLSCRRTIQTVLTALQEFVDAHPEVAAASDEWDESDDQPDPIEEEFYFDENDDNESAEESRFRDEESKLVSEMRVAKLFIHHFAIALAGLRDITPTRMGIVCHALTRVNDLTQERFARLRALSQITVVCDVFVRLHTFGQALGDAIGPWLELPTATASAST